MNSGTDSAMTYLVPSTSVMTVSGVQSARSTRSGFRANTAPFRRVTRITTSVLGLLAGGAIHGPSYVHRCALRRHEDRPVAIRELICSGRDGSAPVPAAGGVSR